MAGDFDPFGKLVAAMQQERQMRLQERNADMSDRMIMAQLALLEKQNQQEITRRNALAQAFEPEQTGGPLRYGPGEAYQPVDFSYPEPSRSDLYQTFGRLGDVEMAQQYAPYTDTTKQVRRPFNPITLVNPSTKEKRLVSPIVNTATGEAMLEPFQIPEGFEVSQETPEEKRAAEILATGYKEKERVTAKTITERQSNYISDGQTAADSIPVLKRSIDLLKEVKTGGIDNAMLKAKQFFGVEGANEAELSANLGRAVLSQLKTTFGPQFTEGEGKRLEIIEARFGKSTAGNIRLLEQTLKIMDRAARRGLQASKAAGDDFTYEEIKKAMEFNLGTETTTDSVLPGMTGPTPGTIEDGYRFKGGNPANPKSWERVK